MDNELFYEPEDGYWGEHDKLSFEAEHLEAEWPKPQNPFIRRMAALIAKGRGNHNLALIDFKQLIGGLIESDPSSVYRFMVIPMGPSTRSLSVCLSDKVQSALPPLRADNACSLSIAVEWMGSRYDYFELSCAADGNYWVHKR